MLFRVRRRILFRVRRRRILFQGTTIMPNIPEDIIEENLLTKLPVKSIARFRCVSRNWNLLFQSPKFIENHLNHAILMNKFNILVTNKKDRFYTIDNDVVSSSTSSPFLGHALEIRYPLMYRIKEPQIIGSWNGLVCTKLTNRSICIWNPATREYEQVPEPPIRDPSADMKLNSYSTTYGFGFDCNIDDYKVLRIVGFDSHRATEASLYSLASETWKELGSIPYYFFCKNKGVLLNGVLYWVAIVRDTEFSSRVVVCFDISDETFHHLPLPNNNPDRDPYMSDLGIWEGKLCLLRRNHMEDHQKCTHQNDYIDVWTMIDNKWTMHLEITAQITDMYYRRPIQSLQNGEILLEGGPRCEKFGLMAYDPSLEKARALKIQGFPNEFAVETYIETLVALNSGTFVRPKQQQGRTRRNK